MKRRDIKAFLLKHFPDKFIVGITLMILLAYLFPGIGMETSPINLGIIIDYGIALIFFFYGLKLSPEKFRAGLKNWKLHFTVQSITFIVFPLLVLPFYPLVSGGEYETLWLAIFFMAVLPSAVSSSVVMVSIANGNIPGAIFNASISGIIGIFLTPLWMGIFLEASNESFAFSEVLGQLMIQILLPVFLGLILNRYWGKWAERFKTQINTFDKLIILIIVYESFSHSFTGGLLSSIGTLPLIALAGVAIMLFFIVFFVSERLAKAFNFSREDTITTTFCGTKKSLVHGSVMYNVLFPHIAAGGIFLLPIMIYHAFQLFYISIIAKKRHLEYEAIRNKRFAK